MSKHTSYVVYKKLCNHKGLERSALRKNKIRLVYTGCYERIHVTNTYGNVITYSNIQLLRSKDDTPFDLYTDELVKKYICDHTNGILPNDISDVVWIDTSFTCVVSGKRYNGRNMYKCVKQINKDRK